MPNCTQCGKQLRADDLFCPYCGQKTGFQDKQAIETVIAPAPSSRSSISVGSFTDVRATSTPGSVDVFEQLSSRVAQKNAPAAAAPATKKPVTSSQTAKQPDKVTSYGEVEIEYSRNHFYINNNAKFDIRRSVLFGRMHDFDFSSERNFNSQSAVMIFIGTCCKKYATDHRDFPDRADMLAIFNAINANDSHTFTDHACTLFEPLLKWVGDRSEDIEAMTVFAGLEALAENDDAHFSLLGVLLATLNGTRLDSTYKNLWMMAALHSKFEAWIKDYAGVYLTGDSPFKGRQVDW